MQVMLMHKTQPAWEAGAIPTPELVAKVGKMVGEFAQAGILRAAAGLRATSQGTRLRFANGQRAIEPGPFVGENELVAGFLILQTESIEHAVELATKFAAVYGALEIDIRPLTEPWDIGLGSRPEGLTTRRYMAAYKATAASESGAALSSVQKNRLKKLLEEMTQANVLLSTTTLQPSSHAKRFKMNEGEHYIMDGPFTESKELISGFITLEVDSIEDAMKWVPRYTEVVDCRELDVRPVSEEFGFD